MKTVLNNLGNLNSVKNLTSSNGNEVPNQFEINFENGKVFQSYESIIAIKTNNQIYLTENWDYSRTTLKYLNWWLGGCSKKDISLNIKSGKFILLSEI